MKVLALDHLNIRTGQLDEMIAWYEEVLGMSPGPRPDFGFPGAWLYADGQPLVHLVGVDPAPSDPGQDLKLEHGAFRATGMSDLLALLEDRKEDYRIAKVEDAGVVQVNVWDPDGNHLHIDFPLTEMN